MRTLFYLPMETAAHFNQVTMYLIRTAAIASEVHVVAPTEWNSTGIGPNELIHCADLPQVRWHLIGGEDAPSLRTRPSAPDEIVDLIGGIDADYTFCRSADVETPSRFPGKVSFMMEGAMNPFRPRPEQARGYLVLEGFRFFDWGFMPELDEAQRAHLDGLIAPMWDSLQAFRKMERGSYLLQAGLPADRRIIALPLELDDKANAFRQLHGELPRGADLIIYLAARIDDDCVLAVTEHPMNVNPRPEIMAAVAATGGKARIVQTSGDPFETTQSLIRHCDGMIFGESKAFALGAFFGKPMLRMSRNATADWLNVYTDFASFLSDVRAGTARAAAAEDARMWFAYHLGNRVFAAQDLSLTLEEMADRVDRPVNPGRWEAGINRWF